MSYQQGAEIRSAVESIATFAAAARPGDLTPNIRQLFKRNILDSLGCAIAALPGAPFQALREQFEEYRASGRCTLIGGNKTSADQAAFFNSSDYSGSPPVQARISRGQTHDYFSSGWRPVPAS